MFASCHILDIDKRQNDRAIDHNVKSKRIIFISTEGKESSYFQKTCERYTSKSKTKNMATYHSTEAGGVEIGDNWYTERSGKREVTQRFVQEWQRKKKKWREW